MPLKKGDIIDEYKRYPDSCGLVVKVMAGGTGFQKIVCCGHELTEEDVVPEKIRRSGRKANRKGLGIILAEPKGRPNSCGFRLMVLEGGQGFDHVECCGQWVTLADEKTLVNFGGQEIRKSTVSEDLMPPPGTV